ncbi:PSD1 and planctomycete cytochrome C domain-containing protein [Stieleria sp. TO1_6]|uniref:PSD1 and planctomycete cytochrome C domain-containing protein n=1 Tax=Stieleria tagensis TaxID=2956795 RepID=UPI00209B7E5F|nr:PSD1 and planctomycete cytochrome C domain-containing protein [Stieleria tagensis]MCO8124385.1 PSD1 and planctomycete cytochrome C domain-containing protein [Stieleria tagensis]
MKTALSIATTLMFLSGTIGLAADDPIDFQKQVQPILAKKCYACHGPDEAEGGLKFTSREAAFAETDSGGFAIVPGDAESSYLLERITAEDEYERMPPEGDPLTEDEIALIRGWIEQGAAWENHWAFEPLTKPAPPELSHLSGETHPIDAFVLDSLHQAGLQANPAAEKPELLRRVYYDLIGLPPSKSEVDAFVADTSPDAFKNVVEKLLASQHYGERWGRHWLDLVRYAETNSFERDGPKANAWKFRDFVIRSFNEDKPYDQFVREQLAGDELIDVTPETLTATGYYRLGIWDDEPADPLQARFDALDDIILTTGQVFFGLTMNCARCHDHKIDPIPQKDYYSMLSFFEDITPYAERGDATSYNQIDISSDQLKARYADNDRQRLQLEKDIHEIEQIGIAKMSGPDQRATEGNKRDRNRVLRAKLQSNLDSQQWDQYTEYQQALKKNQQELRQLPPREQVMGLAQYRKVDEPTYVLFRGSPHSPSDEVGPAFPTLFESPKPELPSIEPSTDSSSKRRLLLAEWITDPENRLTSRVMANRIWQYHFGRGIVESSNNFGQLGTPPTHPRLLDYLANRFIESGWSVKAMHRLILSSQTYQMSSRGNPESLAADPANSLFWRFDPRRLSAEEIRDSILAANGSLNRDVYGPSVYPELSAEVLAGQSKPGSGWGKSSPSQQNRRSVYIHVKRSLITPMLSAFDFPDPDQTCEARFMTLQPAQALSLLNGDFAAKQAQKLADSVHAADIEDSELVRRVIPAVLSREATDAEIADGVELIESLQTVHGLSEAKADQLYCLSVMNWNEFLFVD